MNARPHHHRRSQSNGLKPNAAHARPSRPALSSSKRSPSYNHAAVSHPSTALRRHKSGVDVTKQSSEDSEDMAASFLQFCATCERQIVTPDFSMLYCSESCRKRDSITSTPQPAQSPPISPRTHVCTDHPPVDILPQLSPTVLRPLSTTFSELNLGRVSSISSMTSSTHENDDSYDEHDYDEQFQPGSLDPHVLDLPGYPTSTAHAPRRPSTKRTSTATDVPSLIHSPSSSYGTTASHFHHHASTRSTANKSIDLVIPITAPPSPTLPSHQDASLKSQASTLTTLRIAEGNNTTNNDAKRPSLDRDARRDSTQCPAGAAMGSLRQLFNHDAIRSSSRRRSRD